MKASFAKGDESFNTDDLDLFAQQLTISGTKYVRFNQTVTTTPTALFLGAVSSCGLCCVKNRGSVAINIRSGSGGANVVQVPVGLGFCFFLATNTPYVVTGSSTAEIEGIILSQ